MHIVLEGRIRYKDKKKWKIRYCMLLYPQESSNLLKLHVAKDPAFLHSQFNSSSTGWANTQKFNQSSNLFLPNTEIDDIFGYEIGRHVDKELYVIVLIGTNNVHCMSMPSIEVMFRWADILRKNIIDTSFHVSLKRSGDGSRLHIGPGNLHIQINRLCLIGEPANGNKFICAWLFDEIEHFELVNSTSSGSEPCIEILSRKNSFRGKGKHLLRFECDSLEVFNQNFEEQKSKWLNLVGNADIAPVGSTQSSSPPATSPPEFQSRSQPVFTHFCNLIPKSTHTNLISSSSLDAITGTNSSDIQKYCLSVKSGTISNSSKFSDHQQQVQHSQISNSRTENEIPFGNFSTTPRSYVNIPFNEVAHSGINCPDIFSTDEDFYNLIPERSAYMVAIRHDTKSENAKNDVFSPIKNCYDSSELSHAMPSSLIISPLSENTHISRPITQIPNSANNSTSFGSINRFNISETGQTDSSVQKAN